MTLVARNEKTWFINRYANIVKSFSMIADYLTRKPNSRSPFAASYPNCHGTLDLCRGVDWLFWVKLIEKTMMYSAVLRVRTEDGQRPRLDSATNWNEASEALVAVRKYLVQPCDEQQAKD